MTTELTGRELASASLSRAVMLADAITSDQLARGTVLSWHWGPALLGEALTRLEDHLGEQRYDTWLRRWADHHLAAGPAVDQSDTAAPGLITLALWSRPGGDAYVPLTEAVAHYVRSEPRLTGELCNHLGHSLIGRFYPRSVWVDSLMMFGVFPARYGVATGDAAMIDIAAGQPEAAAALMQHDNGLWAHAWWAKAGHAYPGSSICWARGNGWVIAALPMITAELSADHPRRAGIVDVLTRTSDALVDLQRADGTWATLLAGGGYRELSATALIAAGWYDAVAQELLPDSYVPRADRALAAVTAAVRPDAMPEISGPTIPLPLLPELGYRVIPRGDNHPYGVAAFLWAAINRDRLGA
ncbi:glycoside hydrolase family 88 protein [Microlunatus sp. Y2014]|uniref:glycoside hydrolase family 88 protein n=1 Tax=Microlunatus sp. Y2014 TaxID=3418488 RepID=UPI003DA76771